MPGADPKIRHCVGRRKHPAELAEPGLHHVAVSWLLSRWGGGWAVGAENPVTLCDLGILADQATEPVTP